MKAAAALLLAMCLAHIAAGAAPLRTERLWLFGREYYRLDDWARANAFQTTWSGKKDVQVAKGGTKIQFTTDSRRMFLNGVLVLLSHDVVAKNGVAYITPLDVNSTLAPLLWPRRDLQRGDIKHICIDPGHGGRDTGERAGREQEKKYTLLLAQDLAEELRRAGYAVSLTRTSDTTVEREARPEFARRRSADLFISLHFNSDGGGGDARGIETYCLTPAQANSTNDGDKRGNTTAVTGNRNDQKNILLAWELQKALVRSTGGDDRGVKRARFEVLRLAEMPAVLVESGFLSNTAEARKILSTTWRRQVAQAIVSGVNSYRSRVERQGTNNKT